MLSKDEELRAEKVIKELTERPFAEWQWSVTIDEVMWLAEKLKEVNEELGDVIVELKVYKCEHLDTTKTKDLQDNPIRVCDDCDSVIES